MKHKYFTMGITRKAVRLGFAVGFLAGVGAWNSLRGSRLVLTGVDRSYEVGRM